MPATASRTAWSAPPYTGPVWSTPTAIICADVAPRTRPSPSLTCWRRSGNRVTPAASNLLVRYINQGRVEADHAALPPRKVTGLLTCHLAHLSGGQRALRDQLTGACPEMTVLADQIRTSAELLVPDEDNAGKLTACINCTRAADLPFLHSFANGQIFACMSREPHP
ncbi:hypothetical protein [Streptomyces sp. SGAir0957]